MTDQRPPEEILADITPTPPEETAASPQETPPQQTPEPPQETPVLGHDAPGMKLLPAAPDTKPRDTRVHGDKGDRDTIRLGATPKPVTLSKGVRIDLAETGRRAFRLDQELLDDIVQRIRLGAYKTVAARAVGISPTTLKRWTRTGEAVQAKLTKDFGEEAAEEYAGGDQTNPWPPEEVHDNAWLCYRLMVAMDQAEAEVEVRMVGHVTSAARDNWLPAMTFLERKAPERWKRRDLHEIKALQAEESVDPEDDLLSPEAQDAMDRALEIEAGDSAL